ncbi:hypothetical protein B5F97_02895 [Bacteroides clarus]|jgi:hypothetical protein|uniref:Uncharacterized protein n=2 Tax=Bacteroides clarus TaxID=626929 RepID=A0A1Y3YXB4_9BACE|nr:hypothetical protein B5F97_02895 [Bacteroides clarus]
MKYWIIIDSWNLMETFTTESLSPHIFYLKRAFGNDLTRYISKDGELFNNLVLYKEEPLSQFAIELDDSLFDKSLLAEYKKGETFLYPKTVYYQKGKVRFRFKNQDSIKAFIAESKIIFEVKTIDKYSSDFFIETDTPKKAPSISGNDSFPFDINEYMLVDNLFNSVKGGIVSYLCGLKTSTSLENQSLILSLTSLKNMIAGLNTVVMMGEENVIDYSQYKISLLKTKNEFLRSPFKSKINLFEVLKHILDEIISLSTLRLEKVAEQKSPSYKLEIERLKKKKAEYEDLLYKLEDSNIGKIKEELNSIKEQEAKMGELEGKKRKFFPKGSHEYERKKELKAQINKYKEENSEYKTAFREYKSIEASLSYSVIGVTQYDATISSLFIRFSDNINDILKLLKLSLVKDSKETDLFPNLSVLKNDIKIEIENASLEEIVLYNIIFHLIVFNSNEKHNVISDSKIVELVERAGKEFGENEISKSEVGNQIMNTLRTFWMYKKQKADSFDIPTDLPLLQAIMSFFIKPRGFDQIDRFMLNRGYQLKKYAYMLWGAIVGYASIPKTLTNIINDNIKEDLLDSYLSSIYKSLENCNI